MGNLNEKLAKIDEKQRQLKEQKKKLIQQQQNKERKERTRRLIQKGALSETYFCCSELSEEETKELFIKISTLAEVKVLLPQKKEIEQE